MTSTSPALKSSNTTFVLIVVAVVAVGLLGVAYLAVNRDSPITEEVRDSAATAEVTVEGGESLSPLPEDLPLSDPSTDPEAGTVAPTLTGTGFDGSEVMIGPDGRPKAVYFLAHWCPHCQRELPVVQQLIADGELPEGLDIYAVSTSVDEGSGNYPPGVWLAREGFDKPTMRDDDDSSALLAYGGSGFPYVVYLDGENRVVARSAGELGRDGIVALWNQTVGAS
jgi:thiol-disulfide isomerase/thioredoxin